MRRGVVAAVLLFGVAACASPKLEIREVGGAHAKQTGESADGRVALGLSQLALGNVGLALESFRRALREQPDSHRAMLGLAECYLAMGKPALARRSIEQALAIRPDMPELYRALAAAAEGEGKSAEATQLRREAQLRETGKAIPPASLPPALPPEKATVTIDLAVKSSNRPGPRLVRLSLGEVTLVTSSKPPFEAKAQAHTADKPRSRPLRILNAARVRGIAAATRRLLNERGAQIGDWTERKTQSELRFANADRARAEAVAARLPFRVRMVERAGPLVLLVGRDAA